MTHARIGLVLVLLAVGCGNESASDGAGNGSGGSGGTAGAATGGSAGAAGEGGCNDDPRFRPPGGVCLEQVSGTISDENGDPVSGLPVSVCGPVCYAAETDATGAFTVDVKAHILPKDYSTLPHGRPGRTSFYYQVPATAIGSIDVGGLRVLDLPDTGPALVVKTDKVGAPAQQVTSGTVTLDVTAGVLVKLDVEDVALAAEGKMFRALTIPSEHREHFVPASLGLVALYAFTPFETSFVDETTSDPALARMSFVNDVTLPAGAKIEFLALGSYLFPEWVPPAEFQVVATGAVSSDGTTLEMDPGQGVQHLTWLGIRPAP